MNKNICGAETRSGTPCQRRPAKGANRCKLHGGASPKGTDSPNWKHGLYSKYAGESLKQVLDDMEGMPPEELTKVDNELRLLQALIVKSKAIENGTGDLNDLDTLSKVIERLIKSKQRAVALKIEEDRLIPAGDIQIFLDWMQQLLRDRIGQEQSFEIMTELENFKISDNHAN